MTIRGEYYNIKKEVTATAEKWKVDPAFPLKRRQKVKKDFDELADHHIFLGSEGECF